MTGQHPDEVRFSRRQFDLTAVDGTGLFDPAGHGVTVRWLGTGCYRGYICRYAVVRRRLVLRHLTVGSDVEPASLDGVRPRADSYGWQYEGLSLPVAFTGRLLIGGDFLGPVLGMGYSPAWVFADVRELDFRDGSLLGVTDCSAALDLVREALDVLGTRPDDAEPSENWIARSFSLSYEYSWPGRREQSPTHWQQLSAAVLNRRSATMPGGPLGDGPPDRKS